MNKTIYIFVNGILTFPGLSHNWNRRAVTRFMAEFGLMAESLEYLVFAVTRFLFTRYRAEKLAAKIKHYRRCGYKVVLVGHSNGANVIFNALRMFDRDDPNYVDRVESVHLFSPACSCDCDETGINLLIQSKRLGAVYLNRAGSDLALLFAGWVGWIVGYGSLGRNGFKNCRVWDRVFDHLEESYGHSSWFGAAFEKSMNRVLKNS